MPALGKTALQHTGNGATRRLPQDQAGQLQKWLDALLCMAPVLQNSANGPKRQLDRTISVLGPEDNVMQKNDTHTDTPAKSFNIFGQPMMIFGVPVDQKTIFANHKGVYKKRIEKRQRKLIVKAAFIKFFLQTNERIFCLTTGYSPITVWEQVLTGLAFLFFKRTILVFTEKRLLHIPVRFGAKSIRSVSQILFDDCVHMRLKGRALVVLLKNGRQETFPYIGRKEKKKIITVLASITFQPETPAPSKSRRYLCPRCTHLLPERVSVCESCQLKFKSPRQAAIRSVIIPGGGYFYSRYPLLGFFFALIELLLMGFLTVRWVDISQGHATGHLLLAFLTAGLILEKTMVTYHARQLVQDFLPIKNDGVEAMSPPPTKSSKKAVSG